MANIKQQKKRIRLDEINRVRNMSIRSRVKTMVGYAMTAIAQGDSEKMKTAVPEAISAIDRASAKGVIHGNTAARKKAALMHRTNSKQS